MRDPERQLKRIEAAYQEALSESEQPAPEPSATLTTLTPTLTATEETTTSVTFDSINDVPESAIEATATYILQRTGPCPKEALIKTISRELGFRRLGPRIRERLSVSVDVLVIDEKLQEAGGRLICLLYTSPSPRDRG